MNRTPQYYRRRWLVRIAVWTVFGFWFLPHLLRRDGAWALVLVVAITVLALNLYRVFPPATVPILADPVDRIRDDGLQSWNQPGQNREVHPTRRELRQEQRVAH